jgi:hypothetical protein
MELLLALSPPANGLNVVSLTTKAPPTTKGISTSLPGIEVSDLLFLPLFCPLLFDTVFSFESFLGDKLLLPPFHLLQPPHHVCNGGHCNSQISHIQGTTLLPNAGVEGMACCMIGGSWIVVNITSCR